MTRADDSDEWGRDPAVSNMRRVFAAIEAAQTAFLASLSIETLDSRLGRWRRTALGLFEGRWGRMARWGASLTEEDVAAFYLHCLARIMEKEGIHVREDVLPGEASLKKLFREVLE